MNCLELQRQIVGQIAAIWDKAENKDADLSVAQLRELRGQCNEIFFSATRDVCKHPELTQNRYCFDCGTFPLAGKEKP